MASFFQPGDASEKTTSTPSPAQQALAKFKADILGQLLNSFAGTAPSFASFVKGGPATRAVPGGLGSGMGAVLAAMGQPGAFTSTSTGTSRGPTPSVLSDLTQLGVLGALLANSGAISGMGNILSGVGGALGIGGVNSALGDNVPASDAGGPFNQNQSNFLDALGSSGGEVPYASAGQSNDALLGALLNYGSY